MSDRFHHACRASVMPVNFWSGASFTRSSMTEIMKNIEFPVNLNAPIISALKTLFKEFYHHGIVQGHAGQEVAKQKFAKQKFDGRS
jgi:hypothetical protein